MDELKCKAKTGTEKGDHSHETSFETNTIDIRHQHSDAVRHVSINRTARQHRGTHG